jgi:PAS domain S-box-containing protein
VIDNVEVAVLFVDRDLRLMRFTPAVAHIFPLRQSDCGRRLIDFTNKLRGIDLAAELRTVLHTGKEIEREVKVEDQKSHAALMRMRPYNLADGSMDGVVVSFFEVDAILSAAHAETARYAALSRASGDAILGLSLDGVVNAWSRGAERLLGHKAEEIVGKHISVLAPEGFEAEQRSLLQQVQSGKEVSPYDTRRRRNDGSVVQVSIGAAPILSPEGIPIGISETMRDISERKRAEERNLLLTQELAHRTGNLLAVMHSMIVQAAQYSTDVQSFVQSVCNRMQAMAQAQDLLRANKLQGASVVELVHASLKPFIVNEASFELHGPPVFLKEDAVDTLSLVLHELATNALKYGGLTQPQGRIVVSWELDGPGVEPRRFRMSWREIDGPRVLPPQRQGFGTEMIRDAPKHALGAQVTLDYPPTGLQWSLDVPASHVVEGGTRKSR